MTNFEYQLIKGAGILDPGNKIRIKNNRLNPIPYAGKVVQVRKVIEHKIYDRSATVKSEALVEVTFGSDSCSSVFLISVDDIDLTYKPREG